MKKSLYLHNNIIRTTMSIKVFDRLHNEVFDYETPSSMVVDVASEGVLCASERDIENFEVFEDLDW